MLDHFGLYCQDADVSLPFYRRCLADLDIERVQEQPRFKAASFKRPDPDLSLGCRCGCPD